MANSWNISDEESHSFRKSKLQLIISQNSIKSNNGRTQSYAICLYFFISCLLKSLSNKQRQQQKQVLKQFLHQISKIDQSKQKSWVKAALQLLYNISVGNAQLLKDQSKGVMKLFLKSQVDVSDQVNLFKEYAQLISHAIQSDKNAKCNLKVQQFSQPGQFSLEIDSPFTQLYGSLAVQAQAISNLAKPDLFKSLNQLDYMVNNNLNSKNYNIKQQNTASLAQFFLKTIINQQKYINKYDFAKDLATNISDRWINSNDYKKYNDPQQRQLQTSNDQTFDSSLSNTSRYYFYCQQQVSKDQLTEQQQQQQQQQQRNISFQQQIEQYKYKQIFAKIQKNMQQQIEIQPKKSQNYQIISQPKQFSYHFQCEDQKSQFYNLQSPKHTQNALSGQDIQQYAQLNDSDFEIQRDQGMEGDYSHVCLLISYDEQNRYLSTGTGFVYRSKYLITCTHNIFNLKTGIIRPILFILPNCKASIEQKYMYKQQLNERNCKSTFCSERSQPFKLQEQLCVIILQKQLKVSNCRIDIDGFRKSCQYSTIKVIGHPQTKIIMNVTKCHPTNLGQVKRLILQSEFQKQCLMEQPKNIIIYSLKTIKGMSGSPIMGLYKENWYIIGIHTNKMVTDKQSNYGLYFTPKILNKLKMIIQENQSKLAYTEEEESDIEQ